MASGCPIRSALAPTLQHVVITWMLMAFKVLKLSEVLRQPNTVAMESLELCCSEPWRLSTFSKTSSKSRQCMRAILMLMPAPKVCWRMHARAMIGRLCLSGHCPRVVSWKIKARLKARVQPEPKTTRPITMTATWWVRCAKKWMVPMSCYWPWKIHRKRSRPTIWMR